MWKKFFSVALFSLFAMDAATAGYTDPVVTVKVVVSGSQANQPILVLPASGPASATLVATASNFTPTSYTWSQVLPASQHLFAANAAVTFSSTTTTTPQVTVSFPARGIYQLQVTATAGAVTTSRYIWINVWDNTTGFNPLKKIGRNPGVNPPSSVRSLSVDPGPYNHPRLLFTRADWAELNAKTTASSDVAAAISTLQSALNNNFDSTSGTQRLYANALSTWADGGFDATYFTNSVLPVYTFAGTGSLSINPGSNFPDALLTASYLAWVGTNPSLAQSSVPTAAQTRFRYLAKISSAAARAELNRPTPTSAHIMAVVYDLLYDWMTDAQRNDFRDYLYTVGYGYYNSGGGGLQRGSQPTSYIANGDFPNLADPVTLSGLVIEGEESSVTPSVVTANTPIVSPATGAAAWPNASPASVWNLYRMVRWYSEYFITPWGSPLDHHAYLELSLGGSSGSMLALARRGQNAYVTSNFYQSYFHAFNNLNPRALDGGMIMWDHHDSYGFGNGPNTFDGGYLAQYMYPDDPMIDYTYRAFRREVSNPFLTAVFHVDRTASTMTQVAQAKGLSYTRFDPFRGMGVTRNTWSENDLSLYFECRPDVEGHMHAEANNFSLYALGRAWSSPPNYHITINDAAATVLIQDPTLTSDGATNGYIGESPSSATTNTSRSQFPTPPGKFLEASDDPGGQWTLFAGDATAAYQYAFEGTSQDTGIRTSSFYYSNVLSQMYANYDPVADTATLQLGNLAYNPVQYALRSVFTVRGAKPYVLVIDDITTDGVTARNFRWNMSNANGFGGGSGGRFVDANGNDTNFSMRMQSGSTATDAILYHDRDQASGPRLLVRDISEQDTTGQPAITHEAKTVSASPAGYNLAYGYDNNLKVFSYLPSDRLLITRQNVISPKFKVLLFPHQSGDSLPLTSWNTDKTVASIDLRNGFTDQITLDATQTDKRTRVRAFVRTKSGRTPPTLTLPSNLVIPATANTLAFNGQAGAVATFSISAKDDTNGTLTPAVSSPSGTVFPIGVNPVFVTATDSLGQVTSQQFTVTVVPSAPVVSVTSVTNLPGGTFGLTLGWPSFAGATAYSVKRSTTPGGPYTVISDRQTGTFFTDSGLATTGYYYVVTAWLNSLEGPNSTEIALAGSASPFTGQIIGNAGQGFGFINQGSSYLLTFTGGGIGNYSDQISYLSIPWTGDGSFTTRLVSVTGEGGSVSAFGSYGIEMRDGTAANAIMAASSYNTYVSPLNFISRATTGSLASSSGPFGYQTIPTPMWLRLTRTGNTMTAFYSYDGTSWTQTAPAATINLPNTTLVGLAGGGQNTTLTSALFDNVVFLGTPTFSSTTSSITLNWTGSLASSYSVQRGPSASGPFTTIVSNLTATTYTDNTVTSGSTYYYTVTANGALGGQTVSPAVKTAATLLTLNVPSNQIVSTSDPTGTTVNFTVTANDTIDGTLIPTVNPASGTKFSVGVTTVNCSVTNSNQSTVTGSFTVTVNLLAPQSPTGLSITPGFTTNALSWTAATGASTYNVKRATSSGGPYTTLATGLATTTFTDTALITGTTYYYVVTSVNSTAESSASSQSSGVPISGTATKANNTTTLDTGSSWSTGAVPTSADNALWNGTYTTGTVGLGAGLAINKFQLTGPSQAITISAGTGNLSVGAGGFDLSSATKDLTVNAPLVLTGSQTWNVNTSRTLSVTSGISAPSGTPTLTKSGGGTATLSGTISVPGGITATTGTLNLNGASTLGGLSVSGATVNSTSALTSSGPVSLTSGTLALSGSLNLNGNLTASSGTLTIAGTNAVSGTVGFSGATVTITGDLSTTGTTTLSAGTLNLGATAGGTSGTLGSGSFNLTGGTLKLNRTDATTPFGSVFTGSAGTLQLVQPTTVTLTATNLTAGSSNTLTTVTGTSGATLVLNGAASSTLAFASNVAGLNLVLKNGLVTYNANGGSTDATNVRVDSGTFTISSTAARYQMASSGQTLQVNGGTLDASKVTSFGFRFGGSGSATQTGAQTVTGTQTGGSVLATTFSLGGSDTSATKNPSYTLSGGTFSVNNTGASALQIGADTAGTGTSIYNLSGGKLTVPGTISGAQSGAKQVFNFSGGTLVASAINATNLRDQSGNANGALVQSGGVLAPGDVGTAGKTALTGIYNLGSAGTLAVDIGGTTQATAFQTGSYDYLTVSGATTLAGNLSVSLTGGFTPSSGTTFTVLNSTGALNGAFANVAFAQRVLTTGSEGTFLVGKSGNTVTLSGYTTITPKQTWLQTYFGSINASTVSTDTASAASDGIPNLVKYALTVNPLVPTTIAALTPQSMGSDNRLSIGFTRRNDDSTLGYTVEASNDLVTWTSIATRAAGATSWTGTATVSESGSGNTMSVTVKDATVLSTGQERFLRVKATGP